MRGKGDPAARTSTCTRITPAYAGKSSAFIRSSPVNQDHPRLCGEKSAEIMAEHDAEGITPAYAGKRVPKIPQTQRTRDHPRLCGEKPAFPKCPPVYRGSPPPMRGKVEKLSFIPDDVRITPAYAGKSLFLQCRLNPRWDHPRLCGEKGHSSFLYVFQ